MCRYVHVQEAMQEDHPEAAKRKSSSEAKRTMIGYSLHTTTGTQKSASNTPLLASGSGRHLESTCQTRASPEDPGMVPGLVSILQVNRVVESRRSLKSESTTLAR
jgi:hypothetical protein